MTPLVWRKKTLFLHDFYVMRPLFWLSTIAQEANKVLQEGVSLPFIGSLCIQRTQNRKDHSFSKFKFSLNDGELVFWFTFNLAVPASDLKWHWR